MKHLGDITKISGYDVPTVSIIVGGSPCQDLSIAGGRKGLDGERSGLFMEQIRIIKEMREKEKKNGKTTDSIRPRYMVWENVPGAFSSNKGEDFRVVLEETAKVCDENAVIPRPEKNKWSTSGCILGEGWSIAWRVHDAQFWGVPQRRKRIALVADFGGHTAAEILFERSSVSRDIETSRESEQGTAENVERSFGKTISFQERGGKPGGGKGILIQDEHVGALQTNNSQCVCASGFPLGFRAENTRTYDEKATTLCNGTRPGYTCGVIGFNRGNGNGCPTMEEKQPTLQAAAGESGNNQPLVCQPILLESNQDHATIQTDGISTTLPASMGMGGGYVPMVCDVEVFENHSQDTRYRPLGEVCQSVSATFGMGGNNQPLVVKNSYCIGNGQLHDALAPDEELSKTLNCMEDPMKVLCLDRASYNCGKNAKFDFKVEEEHSQTLTSQGPGAVCESKGSYIVRRLTPLECERLQGYPDYWTAIGDWIDSKGKKHKGEADAPRYKALGNSIALPFWQYLAEKMCSYLDDLTMASLFDGIGGFPLVFSRCGCKPVWASEIEEFPIAVTKYHFGEE